MRERRRMLKSYTRYKGKKRQPTLFAAFARERAETLCTPRLIGRVSETSRAKKKEEKKIADATLAPFMTYDARNRGNFSALIAFISAHRRMRFYTSDALRKPSRVIMSSFVQVFLRA